MGRGGEERVRWGERGGGEEKKNNREKKGVADLPICRFARLQDFKIAKNVKKEMSGNRSIDTRGKKMVKA